MEKTIQYPKTKISIHAPLTGSDSKATTGTVSVGDFNPRSPYGERLVYTIGTKQNKKISIHAPLTGSDSQNTRPKWPEKISIHAPLTGSDSALSEYRRVMLYFNPRSPYGERPRVDRYKYHRYLISIHAPLTGSDK